VTNTTADAPGVNVHDVLASVFALILVLVNQSIINAVSHKRIRGAS